MMAFEHWVGCNSGALHRAGLLGVCLYTVSHMLEGFVKLRKVRVGWSGHSKLGLIEYQGWPGASASPWSTTSVSLNVIRVWRHWSLVAPRQASGTLSEVREEAFLLPVWRRCKSGLAIEGTFCFLAVYICVMIAVRRN
jgi:hypothetical protein